MLHPVGDLPAAVYWRRRALVLALLVSVLGGGGWVTRALLVRHAATTVTTAAAARAPVAALSTPRLERIAPAVTGIRMPARYGPCADEDLTVRLTAPPALPAGAQATFGLVVTNTSALPCVRSLDRALQEVALVDAAGHRIWDSNDCASLAGADQRTLAPRQPVTLPVAWNGRAGSGHCTAPGAAPPPGSYVLRARLGTVSAPPARLALA